MLVLFFCACHFKYPMTVPNLNTIFSFEYFVQAILLHLFFAHLLLLKLKRVVFYLRYTCQVKIFTTSVQVVDLFVSTQYVLVHTLYRAYA